MVYLPKLLMMLMDTLPETNRTSHLKMDGWKIDPFLLGPGLFSEAMLVSGSASV